MSLTPAKLETLRKTLAAKDIVFKDGSWLRDDITIDVRLAARSLSRTERYGDMSISDLTEMLGDAAQQMSAPRAPTGTQLKIGRSKTIQMFLRRTVQAPRPDDGCVWHECIKWYRDNNSAVVFVVDANDWDYTRVSLSNQGAPDFASALTATGVSVQLEDAWATMLDNASKRAAHAWNSIVESDRSATPYAEIEAALLDGEGGIPAAIFRVLEVNLNIMPFKYRDENDEPQESYKVLGVSFESKLNARGTVNAQYWQYLIHLYSVYRERPFGSIDAPKTYANDEKAYTRVSVAEYRVDTPTELGPAWTSWFNRFTAEDKEVHLAALWATLDASNKGSQNVILEDYAGGSGKSHMFKAISRLLGDRVVASLNKDAYGNQFALAKVWDKRMVVFPDNKNPKLMKTEFVHHIQGGDAVDIEYKGKQSFTAVLDLKVWIATNERMEIDSDNHHEARRSIILEINKSLLDDTTQSLLKTGDGTYEDQLSEPSEKAPLLINAYQAYKRLCPTNTYITLPPSVQERLYSYSSADNDMFASIAKTLLTHETQAFTTWSEIQDTYMILCKAATQWQCAATTTVYGNFKQWLTKHFGVNPTRKSDAGRTRGVYGVRINSAAIALHTSKDTQRGSGFTGAPNRPAPIR